jgi:molecular chaperone DnaK
MGIAIGIDLGTSNSSAAIYRKGKVESIPIEGRKIIPSVVSFKNDGQVLVGNAAKARLYIDPDNSVASSKRYIGKTDKIYKIQNKSLTPVDIAREILTKIKTEASKYLGADVTDAVITIPAYFTDEQREATRKAGEAAGFNVLRLLPEPTAAAIAYGLDKERNQTIMVYDLGGGTFDVSILQVENNSFRVLAVDGDSLLGGDDFDEKIVDYIMEKAKKSIGSSPSKGSQTLQRLKEAAEEVKKELSESDIADISIPDILGTHIEEELDLVTFNKMVQPLLKKTIDKIQEVLSAANLTKRDISRVILVGGSTRMKAVQETVTEQIKKPFIAENVDEIVSQGAAIMAANLSAPDKDSTPVPIEVQDVTAHSFGIDLIDTSDKDKLKIYHLISKNTSLPCTGANISWTLRPFQTACQLGVYRQEDIVPSDKNRLGELIVPVSIKPYNVSVVSLFQLDLDGILTFSCAEIGQDSPILHSYNRTGEVDIKLLESQIAQGKIKPKKISINTNK